MSHNIVIDFGPTYYPHHLRDEYSKIVYFRLHGTFHTIVESWKNFNDYLKPRVCVTPMGPSGPSIEKHYEQLARDGVPFYEVYLFREGEDPGAPFDTRVRKAAQASNECNTACYVHYNTLKHILRNDPDVLHVEVVSAVICKPKVVFFHDYDRNYKWPVRRHDFFILHCRNNLKFAFDLTGAQFGINDYLFYKEDYDFRYGCNYVSTPADPFSRIRDEADSNIRAYKAALEAYYMLPRYPWFWSA